MVKQEYYGKHFVIKEVKEYSNRQRINLNKNDGFADGDFVAIIKQDDLNLMEQEYQNQINEFQHNAGMSSIQIKALKSDIEKLTVENDFLKNQQNNLKEIIEDVINPIHEKHQQELLAKDVELNQLKMENKALRTKSNQLCIDFMDLSALQLIFTDKKKILIDDFNKSISVIIDDATITDAGTTEIAEVKK